MYRIVVLILAAALAGGLWGSSVPKKLIDMAPNLTGWSDWVDWPCKAEKPKESHMEELNKDLQKVRAWKELMLDTSSEAEKQAEPWWEAAKKNSPIECVIDNDHEIVMPSEVWETALKQKLRGVQAKLEAESAARDEQKLLAKKHELRQELARQKRVRWLSESQQDALPELLQQTKSLAAQD